MIHHRNKFIILLLALMLAVASQAQAKQSDRKQKIQLYAGDGLADMADTSVSKLRGGVSIKQGTLEIESTTADVYRKKGAFERVVLNGSPATMQQVDDQGHLVTAKANHIEYQPNADKTILKGNVVITRPNGTMTGETITYDMKSGQMNAQGGEKKRIYMEFLPSNQGE